MRNFDKTGLPVHPLPFGAVASAAIFAGVFGLGAGFTAVVCTICAFAYVACCGLVSDRSERQNDFVLRLMLYTDMVIGLGVFFWGLSALGYYVEFFRVTMTLPAVLLLALSATLVLLILQTILLGAMSPVPARATVRH